MGEGDPIARARGLLAARRFDEAYAAAAAAVAAAPDELLPHALASDAAFGRGDLARAVRHAEAAIRVAPDNPGGYVGLARAHQKAGRQRDAFLVTAQAVRVAPESPAVLTLRAMTCADTARWVEAREAVRTLDRVDPGSVRALRARGYVLLRAGDLDGAREALRAALGQAPEDADLLTLLGAVEERALRPGAARRAQVAAVRSDPRAGDASARLRATAFGIAAGTATPARWWLVRTLAVVVAVLLVVGAYSALVLAVGVAIPTEMSVAASAGIVGVLGSVSVRRARARRARQLVAWDGAPSRPGVMPLRDRRTEIQGSFFGAFLGGFAGLFVAVGIHHAYGWAAAAVVAPLFAAVHLATRRTRPRLLRRDGSPASLLAVGGHLLVRSVTFPVDLGTLMADETAVTPLVADRVLRVRAEPAAARPA